MSHFLVPAALYAYLEEDGLVREAERHIGDINDPVVTLMMKVRSVTALDAYSNVVVDLTYSEADVLLTYAEKCEAVLRDKFARDPEAASDFFAVSALAGDLRTSGGVR